MMILTMLMVPTAAVGVAGVDLDDSLPPPAFAPAAAALTPANSHG